MPGTKTALNMGATGSTVRGLIIVSRDQPDLWAALTREFGHTDEIRVLLDRRRGERRTEVQFHTPDRRGVDRRGLTHIEDDLRARQYILVRPHYRMPKD